MSNKSNKPEYRLYQVKGEGENSFWQPIGVAWAHTDGRGVSISLDAVPLNGRITMREIAEREDAGGQS